MIRALAVVGILIIGALVLASLLSMALAKQEQVRPERPVTTVEKPIPAEKQCEPPVWIRFWVQDKDGGLKLVGSRIIEGTCRQ